MMAMSRAMNNTAMVQKVKNESPTAAMLKRLSRNKTAMFGLVLFLILVFSAMLAPLLAPYDGNVMDPVNKFLSPSREHLFGTDEYGRDIFSRVLYGGRYSLGLGFLASLAGTAAALLLGSIAGYFGGFLDNLILRLLDVIQSIPGTLMNICLSAVLGPGFGNTALALSLNQFCTQTRMLRATILSIRQQEYLEASISINCSTPGIILKHVIPNSISPIIVNTAMGVGHTIMAAAGLSFLGLGVQPPTPEWGAMLSAGRSYIRYYPHMVIFPGLMIALTVLSINLLGDGLRDALDPRLKD